MKILKSLFAILLCVLALNANARDWSLYNSYINSYYDGQKIVVNDSNSRAQAFGMFFTLVQKDQEKFDQILSFVEKNLAKDDLQNQLPNAVENTDGTDLLANFFIAYNLLNAAAIFENKSYEEKAQLIIDNLSKQSLILEVNGFGKVFAQSSNAQKGEFTISPSNYPLFVLEKLDTYNSTFKELFQGTLSAIVKGSVDGYVADDITFNFDSDLVVKPSSLGFKDAAMYYLWLGMTSDATPNKRLMAPLYKNYFKTIVKELSVAKKADTFEHELTGMGDFGYDACMLLNATNKEKDFLRSKLKAHNYKKDEYQNLVLAMFALGIDEQRFVIDANGSIIVGE